MLTAILAQALGFAVLAHAGGPSDPPELKLLEAPVTDAAGDFGVSGIARSGSRLVVGGDFAYIGQNTGPLALVDPADGSLEARLPYVRGTVSVVIPDGAGGSYIGGSFSQIGSVERNGLARLTAAGEVDPAFDAQVDGSVTALARSGSRLFVGGRFDTVGGASRVNLGAVDPASGSALPGFDEAAPAVASGPPIAAFAVSESRLYIAGSFYSVGGAPRRSLAALHLDTGRLDPSFDPVAARGRPPAEGEARPDDVNGLLFDMALVGSQLYVGGEFTAVGGRSRSHLAALDPETGGLNEAVDPAPDARVTALALDRSRLYVSGDFERLGGIAAPGAAALDASSGRRDASFVPEGAGELLPAEGRLYQLGEGSGYRLSSSGAREEGFALTAAGGKVRGLQATGSGLLAAGDFASIGGRRQANLAAFRADTGLPTEWRVTTDGRVNGIEPVGRRLYIYGPFSRVGGVPRRGFAALDRRTGRVLPGFRPPRLGGFVSGFVVRGTRIYIAGEFNRLGRVRRANSLFALNTRTGRVIRRFRVRTRSLSGRKSGPGHVQGLAVRGRRLYIGGGFDRVAGKRRPSLAAVDLRTGRLVSGFRPRLRAERREQPYVETIYARGRRLYLLGDFRLVSGRLRNGFAAVQSRTGRVDRSFRPPATAFGRGANLAFGRSRVYLAEESFVNELDGRTGKLLRYGDSRGDEFESVDEMLVLGRRLFAVGTFAPSVADFGLTTDPAGIAIFDLRR